MQHNFIAFLNFYLMHGSSTLLSDIIDVFSKQYISVVFCFFSCEWIRITSIFPKTSGFYSIIVLLTVQIQIYKYKEKGLRICILVSSWALPDMHEIGETLPNFFQNFLVYNFPFIGILQEGCTSHSYFYPTVSTCFKIWG